MASGVSQATIITIKFVHRIEVSSADTNNDDGTRTFGKVVNQIDRLWHIMNGAISEQKQDLISVGTFRRTNIVVEFVEKGSEESWSRELDVRQSLLVGLNDAFNADDIGTCWFAVDSKAMTHFIHL